MHGNIIYDFLIAFAGNAVFWIFVQIVTDLAGRYKDGR